ncbi:MAG: hypothetical protein ACR2QT_07275 [Woeseiaceae bacterium]
MDPAWIQVFVLTLSECVAPAGKTVCQENEIEMQFLSEAECQVALEQLVTLKDQFENTIVNRHKSGCSASARQTDVYASVDEAKAASDEGDWRSPSAEEEALVAAPHDDRLANLKTCEESLGVAPCKSGDIIIEGAVSGRPVEVWRRDN